MPVYSNKPSKFEKRFGTEAGCRKFLTKLRWPDGPKCVCGSSNVSTRTRDLWRCIDCKRDISLTAGTLFADSHYSLELWFKVMWLLSNYSLTTKCGLLQQLLDLGSYHTARNWLLKLNFVMAQLEQQEKLDGSVVVDRITVDISRRKATILVAVERREDGLPFRYKPSFGVPIHDFEMRRIKLRRIAVGKPSSINRALVQMVEKGSEIETDDGYPGLGLLGFDQLIVRSASSSVPSVVISELERELIPLVLRTRSDEQLDRALVEFAFRFNRRHQKPLARFKSLVEQALNTPQMRNASLHRIRVSVEK